MAEVIVFADVEALLIEHLNTRLAATPDPARAFDAIPNPRPARFVRVLRTGGVRRNIVIDEATVAIEAWAETPAKAADLLQLVRAWIFALKGQMVGGVSVKDVGEVAGPANFPDPVSDQARYTLTASVQTRGTAQ